MKKRLWGMLFLAGLILAMLTACGKKGDVTGTTTPEASPTATPGVVIPKEKVDLVDSSSSLYVTKVDNLPDDFIMGMDASSVLVEEASGVKYYNYKGEEQDVFKTLAESGITHIRVRVWNNPFDSTGHGFGGGNCNIDTAIEIGKRATKYGMKLLVDFHYSDFWADPAKQMVPREWKGMDIEQKSEALYKYTKECMEKLKAAGVEVGMVQIGNETNGSMCGEKTWFNISSLMAAGSKAIREVTPEALIAVHFANPEKASNYKNYASKLAYYEIDYDVFGSSYYPYWHGTLENLSEILSNIAEMYGKKVMVLETSYAFTSEDSDFAGNTISDSSAYEINYPFTVQGQANSLRAIIDTLVNKTKNAIGICYWEGTWITVGHNNWEENSAIWEKYGSGWASKYSASYDPDDAGKYYGGCAVDNQAMFDAYGKPLESLKVFALVKKGNLVEPEFDALEDVRIVCDLNGTIELPTKINAIMTDDSRVETEVIWKINENDYSKMYSNGPATYDVIGEVGKLTAHCYVSMIEYNFLENYSFEDEVNEVWKFKDFKKADELCIETKSTDSLTGSKHAHFWSNAENSVEFTLEQEVKNLPTGAYKYTMSIMGGDCGETDIYIYVKINGETAGTAPLTINGYGNWDTNVIPKFNVTEGDAVTVGIYVKCQGTGAGAWGKIDDGLLNSVPEND